MGAYRRLLPFLRPHAWRMAGAVLCSAVSAALDAYSFALLIPFLNALFGLSTLLPAGQGWLTHLLRVTIGSLLDPHDKMGSLETVIGIILVTVTLKNFFVWWGGQLGAQ